MMLGLAAGCANAAAVQATSERRIADSFMGEAATWRAARALATFSAQKERRFSSGVATGPAVKNRGSTNAHDAARHPGQRSSLVAREPFAQLCAMRFPRLALLALAFAPLLAVAAEVQSHGLVFEQWVRDTFFEGYRPRSYTQAWDIPAAINTRFGGVPANPKAAKLGTPVDLGDALRQFRIDEPWILVVGFWRQEGDEKRFANIIAPRIDPAAWKKLWHPITLADLQRLDAVIKDRSLTPAEARAAAQKIKNAPPFSQAIMVVNPKIDSATQRRLQCSLSFEDVFKHLVPGGNPEAQETPALWGVPFPSPVASKPRTF